MEVEVQLGMINLLIITLFNTDQDEINREYLLNNKLFNNSIIKKCKDIKKYINQQDSEQIIGFIYLLMNTLNYNHLVCSDNFI